jgi:hypothetical protein
MMGSPWSVTKNGEILKQSIKLRLGGDGTAAEGEGGSPREPGLYYVDDQSGAASAAVNLCLRVRAARHSRRSRGLLAVLIWPQWWQAPSWTWGWLQTCRHRTHGPRETRPTGITVFRCVADIIYGRIRAGKSSDIRFGRENALWTCREALGGCGPEGGTFSPW